MMHTVARRAQDDSAIAHALASHLQPLARPDDEDDLLNFLAQGRLVLLGEATHGTHEFYALRATLTRRLITEHGFCAVVAEADWPDAWRVNRYLHGGSDDDHAGQALAGFRRFPTWMWRNTVVRDFVEWLRLNNATQPQRRHAGFYGMDLYSLFGSIRAVLEHLERTDPPAARRAQARYACFAQFGQDSHAYGYASSFGIQPHCEDEVRAQWREMQQRAIGVPRAAGSLRDEAFNALQNARLVHSAEEYYRTMFHRRVSSWNLRDQHMAHTLEALERHLAGDGGELPRMVVWAHNSHLGDARATAMHEQGEWNLGQLVRERCGDAARLVGFSTYRGTVTAAPSWDASAQRRRVRDGLPGSYEALLHQAGSSQFWLRLRDNPALSALLASPRLQRAIGVIYLPDSERTSHYLQAHLPTQFDALIHIDTTRALEPLEPDPGWHQQEEPPETFPSGL
ncbi:MAG: hypothetical protein RI884_2420 [Pseudomonadota bacterium]|jgi:erythromycin esterase-like protein